MQVAVDAKTYAPVAMREVRDGVPAPLGEQRLVKVEALAQGAVDFSGDGGDEAGANGPFFAGVGEFEKLAPGNVRAFESAPTLWVGEQFDGLPLARMAKFVYRFSLRAGEPASGIQSVPAVDVCYGQMTRGTSWSDSECDIGKPHVSIRELTDARAAASIADRMEDVPVPAGWLLLQRGAHQVLVKRDRVHVSISATTDEQAVAAARALTAVPDTR